MKIYNNSMYGTFIIDFIALWKLFGQIIVSLEYCVLNHTSCGGQDLVLAKKIVIFVQIYFTGKNTFL